MKVPENRKIQHCINQNSVSKGIYMKRHRHPEEQARMKVVGLLDLGPDSDRDR